MKTELNVTDLDVILESLKYSRLYIENYQYPEIIAGDAYKMKQQKLEEINKTTIKVSSLRRR